MGRWLGWLFAVAGCAHAVPNAELAVVPAQDGPPVRVCWAEYAKSGKFTASGLVVHTAAGIVLVDAGESRSFRAEVGELDHGRGYVRLVASRLVPDVPADEVLRGLGVDFAQVVAVVPTHAHSDHLGGLMDLPDVPVHLHPEERALLERAREGGTQFNVLPAEARRVLPQARDLALDGGPVLAFERSAAPVDGVIVVPLEGHTQGSVGVLVDTGERRVLYAGDAINTRDQLEDKRGKMPILAPTDFDSAAADAQVGRLASLHASDPELVILPAHERAAWVELFGEPGGCVAD